MGAVLICVRAERGPEDSAIILIATWHREGPVMTQQFNMNHGHPDKDLLTSILAYEWFLENKNHYTNSYSDWKTSWSRMESLHKKWEESDSFSPLIQSYCHSDGRVFRRWVSLIRIKMWCFRNRWRLPFMWNWGGRSNLRRCSVRIHL